MLKVIMGKRGTGKTKQVIEMVNQAAGTEAGNVVCIEKGQNLRYNIKNAVKLVDISDYTAMTLSYESFFAYLCGLYSGNYDITHVFIDNLYKVAGGNDNTADAEAFLDKLEELSEQCGIRFTITISADIETATEGIKKYF